MLSIMYVCIYIYIHRLQLSMHISFFASNWSDSTWATSLTRITRQVEICSKVGAGQGEGRVVVFNMGGWAPR